MMMRKAIVLKTTGIYFNILPDGGSSVLAAMARGRIKKSDKIYPGDRVLFSLEEEQAIIEEILPRKNLLPRPNVANIDEMVIVVSLRKPALDRVFIDRVLVLAEYLRLPIILCLNKIDLNGELGAEEKKIYSRIGYKVIMTSALENTGIDELKTAISHKIAVLVGHSGVGKSTILNIFDPSWQLATGSVSEKLNRGRHTTKHVELFPWERGLITDTPGFSRLNIHLFVAREELASTFREFESASLHCRFDSCLHHKEPVCGVKEAVKNGLIDPVRYDNYLRFLEEIDKNG